MANPQQTHETAATAAVRAWFNEHGWKLEPAHLRSALNERGCDDDLIVELIDEGADRRRAAPPHVAKPEQARPAATNGALTFTATGPVPPQNLEAEESVLGAMMISPNAVEACAAILDAGDFYRESHAKIYRAAIALHERSEPVDAITITDELELRGELDQVGGRVRLHEIAALVPASANAGHYARIVHEHAVLRGFIRTGGELARFGWDRPAAVDDAIQHAEQLLDELREHARIGRDHIRITAAADFLATQVEATGVLLGSPGDKVLPAYGLAIVYGKGAAGKTTLVMTAVAALASGTDWLGIPVPRPVRVCMIENEGPKGPYIEKFERFADQWDGPDFRPNVVFYDEPWGRFNLADRGMRDDLLAFTRDQNIDLVAAGPLRDLAPGISSQPGAPSDTSALVDLLKQAGLGTELAWWIVHHENKAAQISGDWDRHPDTLIRYAYEGRRRNRLTWEKIRWGDQGREPMLLEWLDDRVGYRILDTTIPDINWDDLNDKILDAVSAHPDCSSNDVFEIVAGKKTHCMQAIKNLLDRGRLDDRGSGKKGAPRRLHIADGQRQTTLPDEREPLPVDDAELEWGDA